MGHGVVPEIEKMPHGRPGAAGLVGVHDAVTVARVGIGHHDMGVRRQGDGGVQQVDLHDHDHTVHDLLAEHGDGTPDPVLVGVATGSRVMA
ncbi:hypothetical protein GCM10020227_67810 [Streptomyces flavovirens]